MELQTKITTMLDALAEAQSQRDLALLDKQAAIDQVLTPEIKAQLAAIDLEYAGQVDAVNANIAELETAVKEAVLTAGATVKGARLQAVWNKGRVSWDTKRLDGYAAAHPEIEPFRSVGEPSVSIRAVK